MNYLALFLDGVFLFIASFVGCLCLFYFLIPYPFSLVVAFCLGGIITIFGVRLLEKSGRKNSVKQKDKKLYFDTIIRLNLMKESKIEKLFMTALLGTDEIADRKKMGFYSAENKTLYIIRFGFMKVSKADIVRAFNLLGENDRAQFYSESYDQDTISFASRFNRRIILKDGNDAFELLKQKGILPDDDYTEFYVEKKKLKLNVEILKKKNAKKFFFFGVFFSLMSFFVPIKGYYLFCGSVMMIFAIFLKLFGKDQPKDA